VVNLICEKVINIYAYMLIKKQAETILNDLSLSVSNSLDRLQCIETQKVDILFWDL